MRLPEFANWLISELWRPRIKPLVLRDTLRRITIKLQGLSACWDCPCLCSSWLWSAGRKPKNKQAQCLQSRWKRSSRLTYDLGLASHLKPRSDMNPTICAIAGFLAGLILTFQVTQNAAIVIYGGVFCAALALSARIPGLKFHERWKLFLFLISIGLLTGIAIVNDIDLGL